MSELKSCECRVRPEEGSSVSTHDLSDNNRHCDHHTSHYSYCLKPFNNNVNLLEGNNNTAAKPGGRGRPRAWPRPRTPRPGGARRGWPGPGEAFSRSQNINWSAAPPEGGAGGMRVRRQGGEGKVRQETNGVNKDVRIMKTRTNDS